MGCVPSTASSAANARTDPALPTLTKQISKNSNPLTDKEILMRIEAPSETQQLSLSGIKVRYAWVSQRGYYPECKFWILMLSKFISWHQHRTKTIKMLSQFCLSWLMRICIFSLFTTDTGKMDTFARDLLGTMYLDTFNHHFE